MDAFGQKWGIALAVLVVSYGVCTSAMYPASFAAHEEAYNELAQRMLDCCAGPDYMADVTSVEREDPERAKLMRKLGIDTVHYYAGNSVYPGAVVFLERDLWGPLGAMYAYSVDGRPKEIVPCYTVNHVKEKWYRGHSLPCLFVR
jgi:hypothetical protein